MTTSAGRREGRSGTWARGCLVLAVILLITWSVSPPTRSCRIVHKYDSGELTAFVENDGPDPVRVTVQSRASGPSPGTHEETFTLAPKESKKLGPVTRRVDAGTTRAVSAFYRYAILECEP
jgi:hypothetical protein